MASRSPAQETRFRILEAAEEHFRRYGYAKTTIADVAEACRMSPSNVYRFFDSKAALIEAIAGLWFAEQEARVARIARRRSSAADRFRAFLVEHHEDVREQHTSEGKVHATCAMVMEKGWPVVEAHIQRMRAILADILRAGIASGEFEVEGDVDAAAQTLHTAMLKFHHPGMVAQFHGRPLTAEAHALADLLLRALRPTSVAEEK